jgi:acyl dehydratase
MTASKTLSDQDRKTLLAMSLTPVTMDVEKGHIKRFAEAIGDPNPLWSDESSGGIIAPPTFLRMMITEAPTPPELAPFPQMLDGGSEWTYMEPVKPGDVITAVTRFASVNQRSIAVGPAVFLLLETEYTNQRGESVAKQRNTLIRY